MKITAQKLDDPRSAMTFEHDGGVDAADHYAHRYISHTGNLVDDYESVTIIEVLTECEGQGVWTVRDQGGGLYFTARARPEEILAVREGRADDIRNTCDAPLSETPKAIFDVGNFLMSIVRGGIQSMLTQQMYETGLKLTVKKNKPATEKKDDEK